jgi:hypothetical protein
VHSTRIYLSFSCTPKAAAKKCKLAIKQRDSHRKDSGEITYLELLQEPVHTFWLNSDKNMTRRMKTYTYLHIAISVSNIETDKYKTFLIHYEHCQSDAETHRRLKMFLALNVIQTLREREDLRCLLHRMCQTLREREDLRCLLHRMCQTLREREET